MRRASSAVLLALVLLAPSVAAGSERDPEVDDHPDRKNPQLDLLAAWFAPERDGVRFTVKVHELRAPAADHFYFVLFTVHGERYLAGAGFDGEGRLRGHVGDTASQQRPGGLETMDANVRDVEFTPGSPGYLTGVIPWDEVNGLAVGTTMVDLAAGTSMYLRGRGTWDGPVDLRGSDRVYTVERTLLSPGWTAWAAWLVAVPLLLGAGAVAGVAYARRGKANEVAPKPPRVVPVQTEDAPAVEGPSEPAPPDGGRPRFVLRPPR